MVSTVTPTGPTVVKNWVDDDWATSADHWDSLDRNKPEDRAHTRAPGTAICRRMSRAS
jgi:hypothetical protein